jgi:N-acyl-D-aspartate/D-glutamate deacylase
MQYDLVIRHGMIVDGSGGAAYPADVGIAHGRIATIGRITGAARRTIDAGGLVVTPGFVDGHTHMDAQVFWDQLGASSCYHGVTTAIMGNCGFTLAPCAAADADFVFRNLERAEDLPREAMLAGIDWRWETFAEFLDVVDALPKGINYGGYIGHSALRTWAMGERAFSEQASDDELRRMRHELQSAIRAGAIGFSTSRTYNHLTSDDRPVASRVASWDEVRALVNAMGETGAGIFEIASETPGRKPERQRDYFERLINLTVESGRPLTFGMFSTRIAPEVWRPFYEVANEAARAGGRIFVQAHSRHLSTLMSFKTHTPFDAWEGWRELRAKPLDEQKALLRDPAWKRRLVEVANRPYEGPAGRRPGDRDDRHRARTRLRRLLPPAAGERGPGPRAGDDAPSAQRRDLLRFGRACRPDHGFLAADAPHRPLGAPEAGVHAGGSRAPRDLRHRDRVGPARSRARARRHERRPARVRSGHAVAADARGRARSTGRREAPRAEVARHPGHHRQR